MGIWTSWSRRFEWRADRSRMSPDLGVTPRSLLTDAARTLAGAGIGDARREAFRIWQGLAGRDAGPALLDDGMVVPPEHAARFRAAFRRRAAGEPLGHVTGWTGFRHLTLRSDHRALIPRPETEGLVELLLARVRTG